MRKELYRLWILSAPEFRVLLQAARISRVYGLELPEELTEQEAVQAVWKLKERNILRVGENGFGLEESWKRLLEYLRNPEKVLFFQSQNSADFCFRKEELLYSCVLEGPSPKVLCGFLTAEYAAELILEHAGTDLEDKKEGRLEEGREKEEAWIRKEQEKLFESFQETEVDVTEDKSLIFLAGEKRGRKTIRCLAVGEHPFFRYLLFQKEGEKPEGERYSRKKLKDALIEMMEVRSE